MEQSLQNLKKIALDSRMHMGRWKHTDYVLTKFENIAHDMEKIHGVDNVWNVVKNIILETNDKYVCKELIESYGNSNVPNFEKRLLLIKILLDDSIEIIVKQKAMDELNNYLDYDKDLNCDEFPELIKTLYYNVNDNTRHAIFSELVIRDFINSDNVDKNYGDIFDLNSLVRLFSIDILYHDKREILDKVENYYVPKYDKKKIKDVFDFMYNHKYSTIPTKEYVDYVSKKLELI